MSAADFWFSDSLQANTVAWWRWLLLPACVVLCGVGYRIRGGLWNRVLVVPGQLARLLGWGIPCTLTALAARVPVVPSVLVGVAAWGCSTIGLFGAIDLGRNDGSFWGDFWLLVLRGALGASGGALVLWWAGAPFFWVMLLAGAAMGPCYCAARQLRSSWPGFGAGGDFPEMGEALTGACIGLGIWLAAAL